MDPLLGTEVGRYRIERLLGEGGMGAVYLAEQPVIGSRVAIKVLSQECARSPELLERFFAEARSVNLIRHENIVSVLDLAQLPDGRPYIVMEFIEGQTLGQIVRALNQLGQQVPIGGVVQVAAEMLSALGAAHALGIVHRDLKPDNVLVTAEGHAKVLDFGIAKLAPGLGQNSPRTRTGALLGTPSYMAPEQISGAGQIDARTDIYAAGIVLFEAMTGTQPFVGETLFDLMRAHMEQAPPPPRSRRPEMPPAIEQVILTALAKDPAHRFQSAGAMGQALRQAAGALHAEQWRSLSGRSLSGGRISLEGIRVPTPNLDPARSPTHLATPIPAPPPDIAKTEATPSSRKGLYGAIAAITIIGAIVGAIVLGSGKNSVESSGGAVAEVGSASGTVPAGGPVATGTEPPTSGPKGEAPSEPPPTPPAGTTPKLDEEATRARSVEPPARPTAPTRGLPSGSAAPASPSGTAPTIVGGGSAADHGVIVGPNVISGPGVIIGSGGGPPPGVPGRVTRRFDAGNPKKFDAMAYAPKALALARTVFADAGFVRMDTYSVFPSGLTDLTIGDDDTTYWFRSPSHSARPAGIPKNQDVDITCYVEVSVNAREIEVWARDINIDAGCTWPIRSLPRCSLAGVWAQAKAKGADTDTIAKIGFLADGEWFFDNDGDAYEGLTESFADKCH